jgi:hypothetical protein
LCGGFLSKKGAVFRKARKAPSIQGSDPGLMEQQKIRVERQKILETVGPLILTSLNGLAIPIVVPAADESTSGPIKTDGCSSQQREKDFRR